MGHRKEYAWCDIALHEKNDKGVPFPCLFPNEVIIANMNIGFSFMVMLLKIGKIYLFHWIWKGSPKVLQLKISKVDAKTLLVQGGRIKFEIGKKLVFIGTNGGFVYVGCRLLFWCNSRKD